MARYKEQLKFFKREQLKERLGSDLEEESEGENEVTQFWHVVLVFI